MKTLKLKVLYYVQDSFHRDFNKHAISRIEEQIEAEYITSLRHNCFRERQSRDALLWRARHTGNPEWELKAKKLGVPNCDRLNELHGTAWDVTLYYSSDNNIQFEVWNCEHSVGVELPRPEWTDLLACRSGNADLSVTFSKRRGVHSEAACVQWSPLDGTTIIICYDGYFSFPLFLLIILSLSTSGQLCDEVQMA